MPWWSWVLLGAVGLWLALFGFDLVSRLAFESAVRFNRYKGADQSVLFVHFPGLVGDGVTQIWPIMDVLLCYGDVLCVSHTTSNGTGKERFHRGYMVRSTADKLAYEVATHRYSRVILVGTSQGGKHAYRIGKRLKKRGIKTDKILIDSPRHWGDLPLMQQLLAPLMVATPFGVLWNRLSSRAMKILFIPPAEENIDPYVDRRALDATVRTAQASLLSYYRDQVVDILWPAWMQTNDWANDHVAYIRSLRGEDVVRGKRASRGWNEIAGGRIYLYEADAEHAAYGENPGAYREVLPHVLQGMGL